MFHSFAATLVFLLPRCLCWLFVHLSRTTVFFSCDAVGRYIGAFFSQKIQPVRADGNLLLCTLLLGNVAVNALLSIVMAELTSGLVGFALATVIITIFGEIIPQVGA